MDHLIVVDGKVWSVQGQGVGLDGCFIQQFHCQVMDICQVQLNAIDVDTLAQEISGIELYKVIVASMKARDDMFQQIQHNSGSMAEVPSE